MENSTGSLLILLECQFAIDLDPTLLPSKIRKNRGSFTGLPLQKLVRACARRDSLTTLGGGGGAGRYRDALTPFRSPVASTGAEDSPEDVNRVRACARTAAY